MAFAPASVAGVFLGLLALNAAYQHRVLMAVLIMAFAEKVAALARLVGMATIAPSLSCQARV
jgi:hypothetical protein